MTMTDDRRTEEGGLAPWFDAGRDEAPLPSGDWLARMEAMALEMQPAPAPAGIATPERAAPAWRGWLRDMLRGLGGWPAMAGLVAACATGVWFGVVAPSELSDWLAPAGRDAMTAIEPASGFDYAMLGL
ncbi:hypothetical protein GCM10011415_23360 [Salipiger pallidus]|uniref:Dihydroorotate dehydrogenase n=2 Tax=Salipiger pallidus TaxID=1775170 RepID=A0A8J2ZJZ5_9RHOB|nr:hypothetical protein GCM10011415_23360 [Salipiger pallidus]